MDLRNSKGIVFDIQYYAIYDGPGIRTCVFLKGCPLRCVWCHNPESQSLTPEMSYFAERCARCGQCVEACSSHTLHLTEDGVVRDRQLCVVCSECAQVCPNQATEKIGKELSANEIAESVLRDRAFYEASGGGVTISGGEPTLQAEFLLEILRAVKQVGIHTAIETCGYFDKRLLDSLVELVDLFLYDIKHIDSATHKKFAGVSNERILANFSEILSRVGNKRITPRIPLIPSFNDDAASIDQIAAFLRQAGYHGPVHLMPYNRMAKTKWEKIGKGALYKDMGVLSDQTIETIASKLKAASFETVCNT